VILSGAERLQGKINHILWLAIYVVISVLTDDAGF